MTRRFLLAVAALCALLCGAGCGDREAPLIPEMDEPFYVQGVQLNKSGRTGEALTSFLKVIGKRGDRGAPESHLEVGVIHLNHTKDPVLAYYHFKRYLELQPNSAEAPRVRGMLDAALREILRRFPGRPVEDQSVRLAAAEEITKLRRENDELRAELQTLRGGGAVPVNRPGVISLPNGSSSQVNASRIVPAPARAATVATLNVSGSGVRPPGTSVRSAAPSGRTHTVRAREGLFAIARHFDAKNPSRKMREIIDANPDVLPNGVNTPLQPGMTLRIP